MIFKEKVAKMLSQGLRKKNLRSFLHKAIADSYLYLLNGRENEQTQLFVKVIKADDMRKTGARLKDVLPLVGLHQAPISCQSEITDRVESGNGLCFVFDDKTSSLQNVKKSTLLYLYSYS